METATAAAPRRARSLAGRSPVTGWRRAASAASAPCAPPAGPAVWLCEKGVLDEHPAEAACAADAVSAPCGPGCSSTCCLALRMHAASGSALFRLEAPTHGGQELASAGLRQLHRRLAPFQQPLLLGPAMEFYFHNHPVRKTPQAAGLSALQQRLLFGPAGKSRSCFSTGASQFVAMSHYHGCS